MMHDSLRELVQLFWGTVQSGSFSDKALLHRLTADGGLDAQDLSQQLVTELLNEKQIEEWNRPAFACSELVSFYLALNEKMSGEQIAGAIFVACVLADGARAGEHDWSLEHSKVIRLSGILSKLVSTEDGLLFMRYVFGKGGQGPIP